MLIHTLPPRPAAPRVRVWRRLQKLGAVALKGTVWVLPRSDEAREDLEWVCREVKTAGGEATVCEAAFVEGLTDRQVRALFTKAREAEYRAVLEALTRAPRAGEAARREVGKLERQAEEIARRDHFGARARATVRAALAKARARHEAAPVRAGRAASERYAGRTWVTRRGVFVDRMASAWLIRRFIDPKARFRFVDLKTYRHRPKELRFDMFEGEFTHQGARCTFEVLQRRFRPKDRALARLGEFVHDLDVKDERFAHPEVKGFGQSLQAIAAAHPTDVARLARASAYFDDWYALLASRRGA